MKKKAGLEVEKRERRNSNTGRARDKKQTGYVGMQQA
jgi:hypothetical protein